MDTEETRTLVKRYYDALTSGDKATVFDILAEDVTWDLPASAPGDRASGREEVGKALTSGAVVKNFDLSKPFKLDVRSLICDGNTAVVQQRLTATAKATGNLYDNQYCWVYTCDGGHITHMEEYADTVLAAKAMGWDD